MDTSRYRRKHIKVETDVAHERLYPHNLSLYQTYPSDNIPLSDFLDYAYDRLQVLRVLEYATLIGNKIYSAEWKNCIIQELKKLNLNKYVKHLRADSNEKAGDLLFRHEDNVSHYILRLTYCRTEELRRWFLNRELELFKLRLMCTSDENINEFMKAYDLKFTLVSDEEKNKLRDEINCSTGGHFVLDATPFYKVSFLEVLSLMQQYKVFIQDGLAYVPNYEISTCIISTFRTMLSANLAHCSKRINNLNDERCTEFTQYLNQAYTGKIYDTNNTKNLGKVNLTNLQKCAAESFPLCMRNIHDTFKSVHHLKHSSRLQYMFFLKGLGMVYEDVMQHWHEEFTKKMDETKFEKQYAYGVKHAFGKVGRMQNYSAYSCAKIIGSSVGPGECHGCPYKHWDSSQLKTKLEELGLTSVAIDAILEAKQGGHYQIACGKYFRYLHGQDIQNPLNHPNQYFEDSFDLRNKGCESKLDVSLTQSTQASQF